MKLCSKAVCYVRVVPWVSHCLMPAPMCSPTQSKSVSLSEWILSTEFRAKLCATKGFIASPPKMGQSRYVRCQKAETYGCQLSASIRRLAGRERYCCFLGIYLQLFFCPKLTYLPVALINCYFCDCSQDTSHNSALAYICYLFLEVWCVLLLYPRP